MLMAFLSYQGRFSASISSLIDKYFEFKMLSVYNERLADIVLTEKEIESVPDTLGLPVVTNNPSDTVIEFDNVLFSYGKDQPPILNGASFSVKSNEIVALVGPSGCGKSTISKLLLGIYSVTSGSINYFGNKSTASKSLRTQVGAVLQEDQLFSGSIIENITFFAGDLDEEWLVECARRAGVHDDIERLNMGYHTLVGEMGSSLSGGQKQRILIARALYKKPKFLVLDEATSSLDIYTESFVCQMFKEINIPILMIAHRPETIASADRVLLMEGGLVQEIPNNFKQEAQDV
ncbi:ATP-binding cassette domain-containing protein [Vibrio artabrorum]